MQERIIEALSIIFAVAIGYGFAGPIYVLAGILSPNIAPSAQLIFQLVVNYLYTTSIITWTAGYQRSIRSVLKDLISPYQPKKEADRVYQETLTTLQSLYDGKNVDQKISLNLAVQNLQFTNYKSRQSKYLPQFVFDMMAYTPIGYFDPSEREKRANKYRGEVIDILKKTYINEEKSETIDPVAQVELEKNLYPNVENSIFSGLPYGVVDVMGWLNAFGVNSIGLIFFGAIPLINTLKITSIALSLPIIAIFYTAGVLGALGITKKYALKAYRTATMPYESQHQELLSNNLKKRNYIVAPNLQVVLSLFMAFSISLGNFLCNIALGEILFSGENLFDPTLMGRIVNNPLAVNPLSLYLGIGAAICTFSLVSLLSVNSIYEVSPQTTSSPVAKTTSKSILRVANSLLFPAFIAAVAAVISSQVKKILVDHLMPIGVALTTCIALSEYYKTIDEKRTLPKLLIFSTSVASTITTYYFGCSKGSLLETTLGRPAQAVALISSVANATLTPSILSSMGVADRIAGKAPSA